MDTVVVPKAWWTSKVYQGVIVAVVAKGYALLAARFQWKAWEPSDADFVTNLLFLAGGAWAFLGQRLASRPIGDPTKPIITTATTAGTASGEVPVAKGGLEP